MVNSSDLKQYVPIFVGSTYEDLKEYRAAVRDALIRLESPVYHGMEYFGSKPGTPKKECLKAVKKCEIYIGIFAMRYGSIDKETGKSMTHLEYEEAQRLKLPSLIYLIDEHSHPVLPIHVDTGDNAKKLRELKNALMEKFTVSFFTSPEDLAKRISQDLPPILESFEIRLKVYEKKPNSPVSDNSLRTGIRLTKSVKNILAGIIVTVMIGIIVVALLNQEGRFASTNSALKNGSGKDTAKVQAKQPNEPSKEVTADLSNTMQELLAISNADTLRAKLVEYNKRGSLAIGAKYIFNNLDGLFVFVLDEARVYGAFLFHDNNYWDLRKNIRLADLPEQLRDKKQIWVIESYKLVQE